MNLTTLIYLADITDRVQRVFGGLGLVLILTTAICVIGSGILSEADKGMAKLAFKMSIRAGITAIIISLLSCLIPSKQGLYLIGASEGVQEIAANPRVKALASNSLKLLEDKIKEELDSRVTSHEKDLRGVE